MTDFTQNFVPSLVPIEAAEGGENVWFWWALGQETEGIFILFTAQSMLSFRGSLCICWLVIFKHVF